MSVEKYTKRVEMMIKQQGAFFPVLVICVIMVFPLITLGFYMPKDFKEELSFFRLIQLILPGLAPFWEIQFLNNWINKKGSELYYFIEPHPWKESFFLDIMFIVFVLSAYGILSAFGMDVKKEYIKIVLLCMILQIAALLLLIMFKSIILALGGVEALLCVLSFNDKSPFYWNLENPFAAKYHLIDTSVVVIVLLLVVTILLFMLKSRFGSST